MRNYKDMADAVFARRDEYVASVKRKKKIALNASLSLCSVCLAVLGAFGIWKSGVLTPDPNVIGTKPQSYTESAPSTLHSFGSNATSEGKYSETTEYVSGNSKPQNNSEVSSSPAEDSRPSATDPVEKPTSPNLRPGLPVIKPTLPVLKPTLPADTDAPGLDVKPTPDVPPTSGGSSKPTVVATDPIESEPGNDSVGEPDIVLPTVPEPTTAQPTTEPNYAAPDEPVYTEPCWTQAPLEEPTDAPCGPETQPPTLAWVNSVEGKVVDQYGNPVKGAVINVYSGGKLKGTYTTNSRGYYFISGFSFSSSNSYGSENYVAVVSVPDGYRISGLSESISTGYNYIILTCNKN